MQRAELKVELLNPEAVQKYLKDVGEFGKVCYATDTEVVDPTKIAKHCIDSNHWSPARATYFIFKVSGISRVCSHQIVRHRIGVEINQRSQRYCDESAPVVVIPESIAKIPEALEKFLDCVNLCYKTYGELKNEFGISGDDARSVLLNCTATEMTIACTPQALIHFCNERLCNRASTEIHNVARKMAEHVCSYEKYFGKLLVPKCVASGYCVEANTCHMMPKKEIVLAAYVNRKGE